MAMPVIPDITEVPNLDWRCMDELAMISASPEIECTSTDGVLSSNESAVLILAWSVLLTRTDEPALR